jgi:hypothetical protein
VASTQWLDVRNFIKTNSNYRDAEVNWELTQQNISKNVSEKTKHYKVSWDLIIISQPL